MLINIKNESVQVPIKCVHYCILLHDYFATVVVYGQTIDLNINYVKMGSYENDYAYIINIVDWENNCV